MDLRTEFAPPASFGKRNVVGFVRLGPGESIVWHWTHEHDGSYVSGYTVGHKDERGPTAWQERLAEAITFEFPVCEEFETLPRRSI